MWEGEGKLTCADDDTADKAGKRLCTPAGRTMDEDRLTPWHVILPYRGKMAEAVRSILAMMCWCEVGQQKKKLRSEGGEVGTKNATGCRLRSDDVSALACVLLSQKYLD